MLVKYLYNILKFCCFIHYFIAELEAVVKMSLFWNLPVISYMPTTSSLGDRSIYKSLSRISSKNTNSIAKAVVKLVEHYHWSKVSFKL